MTQTTLITNTGGLTADLPANSHKITNLSDPASAQDAATKAYVDANAQGLVPKAAVVAATTGAITLSGAQTIDGVAVVATNRVLVKNQADQTTNGIYVAAAGAWSRSTDADAGSELVSAYTFVTGGTTNINTGWFQSTPATITLGVSNIVWTLFSAAGTITASTGLTKVGSDIQVATGGITSAMIADATITDTDVAAANKDGAAGTASLRTLGTAATQAAAGNDSRLSDSRAPTGAAGGGLTGTFPNPTVATTLDALPAPVTDVSLATHKITNLGTPSASTDAATKAYVDGVSGGSTASMGYLIATDISLGAGNYLVADGGVTADGVVASGTLSTLTSAAALFPTSIATQTVTLFQDGDITDGSITAGAAVLTSASAAIPAWVVGGMTVLVCGAGAAGVTFVATVLTRDSSSQVTLTANATTTVVSKPMKFYGVHSSVVTSRASTSSLTMTTPAPYAFTAAHVSWGTNNLAAGSNLMGLAKTQNKVVWVPAGDYNFIPSDASHDFLFGHLNVNQTVAVHGVRGLTRFINSRGSVPTFVSGVVNPSTNTTTDIRNWVSAYVGPPPNGDGTLWPIALQLNRGGTAKMTVRAEGIDSDQTYSPGGGIWQAGASGTATTRMYLKDCQLVQQFEALQGFVNTGTDSEIWDYGSRFETTCILQTMPTDNAWHPHATYLHPSVARRFMFSAFKIAGTLGGSYHVHDNGSPSDVPKFVEYLYCTVEGNGGGILSQGQAKTTLLVGCQATGTASLCQLGGGNKSIALNCELAGTGGLTFTGAAGAVLDVDGIVVGASVGASPINASSTTGATTINLRNITIAAMPVLATYLLALSSQATTWNLDRWAIGGASNSTNVAIVDHKGAGNGYVARGRTLAGTFFDAAFMCDATGGTLGGVVEIDLCDFSASGAVAVIKDYTASATDRPFRVNPTNKFGSAYVYRNSNTISGSKFMARPRKSPTAVVPAANTVLDHDYSQYVLTPTGNLTINNVFRKDADGTFGDESIIRWRNTAAFTLTLSNSAGNLHCDGGVDLTVTQNQMVEMIGDGAGAYYVHRIVS